jgi:3-phenylpropionate/trans-cinnamate dioxygenase ferredoxin subunit
MSEFIELTTTGGFEPGTMREVELEGHKLLVVRAGEEYFVTDARCPHLGGPLAKGVLEGTVITCPWHHSQFDVRDGSCLRWTSFKGAVLTVAELARHPRPLRAYECVVNDGRLLVGAQKPHGSVPGGESD